MDLERPARATTLAFGDLSNELILLILGNFCFHCRQTHHEPTPHAYLPVTGQRRHKRSWYSLDVASLYSMALVSKRFSPLAHETLYHTFAPGYGDSWRSFGYSWERRAVPFLRTVARNPDRAASVRHIHVDHNLSFEIDEGEVEAVLYEIAHIRGIELSNFVAPFRDRRWRESHHDDYRPGGDELLAMLLACLPRLKTLSLGMLSPDRSLPASALEAAGLSALAIETLDVSDDVRWDGRRADILKLASYTLRNLYMDYCRRPALSSLAHHASFPNLRSLCLSNSPASGPEMALFLSRHAGLEIFSYHSGTSLLEDSGQLSLLAQTNVSRNRCVRRRLLVLQRRRTPPNAEQAIASHTASRHRIAATDPN